MKKILVATGTSANRMNKAAGFIAEKCKARGIEVEIVSGNIYEVKVEEVNPDVIVLIGNNTFKTDIPIINGTAFVTQIGMDQTVDQIIQKLQ
ncbi:hypothetical protein [Brevibacillus daliensis]|uniref:hypothetical protein n=1 Tax=Brevibacillus daliensis TaxID=2892995 RepID=UPI001E5D9CAF|nr:hypothetical protein [Brevibacillus daliensis]